MAGMADDPYLWLEEIDGDAALAWVRERNESTTNEFSDERFEQMRTDALAILDTDTRIPYVRRRGEYLYTANGADGLGEIIDRMFRRHITRLEMYFRHAAIIARDEAQ